MHNFTPIDVYVLYSKYVKSVTFFILHNFTYTDGDAITSSHVCQFHALLCKFLYFTPPDAIANILIKNAQRKCQKVI